MTCKYITVLNYRRFPIENAHVVVPIKGFYILVRERELVFGQEERSVAVHVKIEEEKKEKTKTKNKKTTSDRKLLRRKSYF